MGTGARDKMEVRLQSRDCGGYFVWTGTDRLERLRTMSMFLEESCYTLFQQVAPYKALMEAIAEHLLQDPSMARDLCVGGISAKEFLKNVDERRRMYQVARMKSGLPINEER